jgi:hypothetical protein
MGLKKPPEFFADILRIALAIGDQVSLGPLWPNVVIRTSQTS